MPARIVMAHSDPVFLAAVADGLTLSGFSVAAASGSMRALQFLENAKTVDLLITRAVFEKGTPNGAALAQMAKLKRPHIQVLFTALPVHEPHVKDLGTVLLTPVAPSVVVGTAIEMLRS